MIDKCLRINMTTILFWSKKTIVQRHSSILIRMNLMTFNNSGHLLKIIITKFKDICNLDSSFYREKN